MQKTTLLHRSFLTHDVQRFVLSRPEGFVWKPGQAVELAIDAPDWRKEVRPFTPTSLPNDEIMEFTIKRYTEHDGVTERLHKLEPGTQLLISDEAFGSLTYRNPGVFIAAGAGITPMLAIIRDLVRKNAISGHQLIFANKAWIDIICERELIEAFGAHAHCILSNEHRHGYDYGHIDRLYIEKHLPTLDRKFYLCGPPPFMKAVKKHLENLGADVESVVFDQ